MSSPTIPADLLDLKMLPAWANEPARTNDYADFEGEEIGAHERRGPRRDGEAQRRARKPRDRRDGERRDDRGARPRDRNRHSPRELRRDDRREHREPFQLPPVGIRFLPHPPAFNNVIAQIKAGSVAYSVFALARLFLDKPERYDVRLTGTDDLPLHQLGEDGAVAADRRVLENNAFASARDNFFTVETTQTEPLKGNFTNVARCRLSGTLLGPTNYHSYQPQLRSLYEQRFSRRMSFADYQKQIEIVNDPAVVEQWKEQARTVTKFATKNEEPPITFNSAADAERHFKQHYLPSLLRSAAELTIDGVTSRALADRGLRRAIEEAWVRETRSPSKMMQELASGFRQAGLNIFRHRRGMLFVSPTRARPFDHDPASVSTTVNRVLEKISATPGINRKQLADELAPANGDAAEAERTKLTLASDLRWLISEGYVIEFNDGSLDLPRVKKQEAVSGTAVPNEPQSDGAAAVSAQDAQIQNAVPTDNEEQAAGRSASTSDVSGEEPVESPAASD